MVDRKRVVLGLIEQRLRSRQAFKLLAGTGAQERDALP
jgi:hypothetical protein